MTSRRRFMAATAALGSTQALPANASPDRTLRIAFPVAETGFDPVQSQDQYSGTINAHIFDAPLEYTPLARPARLQPNTAAAMPEMSVYTAWYTLRRCSRSSPLR